MTILTYLAMTNLKAAEVEIEARLYVSVLARESKLYRAAPDFTSTPL